MAAWVGENPDWVTSGWVLYGSCPMCEIANCAPMGHSIIESLETSSDQHVYSELLDEANIDLLHTLGVDWIRNQIWRYPPCNVYRLWQPDEFPQLLLGFVQDWLHWLLKYLNARDVKDQFDDWFTWVPRNPAHRRLSKPFYSDKRSSWQGKAISGIIRTLAVNCTSIVDCSKDDGKTVVETDSDEIAMGVERAFYEFSLLVSQQNLSDLHLTALDDVLKRLYLKNGAFWEQKMSKSAKAKVDEQFAQESNQFWEQMIEKSMRQWRFSWM